MKTTKDKGLLSAEESSAGSKSTAAKCILMYEDDPEILFLCEILLKKEKYRVEALNSCENVVNDIGLYKPDLILMDLWMPHSGGEKAVELIKKNPATWHIPVLLFSANDRIEEISKEINADGFITKPFDLRAFKKIIAQNM